VRARSSHAIGVLCCALALCAESRAHDPESENPEGTQSPIPMEADAEAPELPTVWTPWRPKPPEPRQWDWVQLISGEWLKGDITVMRDEVLEFDSKELDDLEIDWDKVQQIRSPRVHTFVFEERQTRVGVGKATKDEVIIQVEERRAIRFGGDEVEKEEEAVEERFDRKLLIAIIPGRPTELNYWSGKLSLGVSLRKGNTDQQDLSGLGWLRRESSANRLRIDYNGAISLVNGEQNENSHRANAKWDVYLSRQFYLTPALFEFYSDPFTNIAYRLTPSVGVGYKIYYHTKLNWEVEGGAGYQLTHFESPPASGEENEGTASLRFATNFHADITKRVDVDFDYTFQLGVPDVSNRTHHFLLLTSFEITKIIDIDISFNWDRVANPVPGEGGNTPVPDDYRLSVGLGLDF